MAENINITMNLMLRELEVARFNIRLYEKLFFVDNFQIINLELLPHELKEKEIERNVEDWLMSRVMPPNTSHYIFMLPIIFHRGTERRPYAQFAMSLTTNGISLSDHYWLNTDRDTTFCFEGRQFLFKNNSWEALNPWRNDIWSGDLNQFLFNDMLFSCSDDPLPEFNNPIFTTNGDEQKMWYKENDIWMLEKRLSDEQLTNEFQCFEFFKAHGFLTPKCETIHHDVANRYQFYPDTIREGFNAIKKQCLTSKAHQLTPLSWYIGTNCKGSIHDVIEQAKNSIQINSQTLKDFENAVIEYKTTYGYKQIASNNLGFLIDTNNHAIPAVWSNIGYVNNNPFIAY